MIFGLLAKYRKDHQNCILRVQRHILAKNCFWEKNSSFSVSQQKTFGNLAGCSVMDVKNFLFTCPEEEIFEGTGTWKDGIIFSFLDFGRDFFNLSHKNSEQSLQNCVLRIQSTNSRKNFSWKILYLRSLRTPSKKFRAFREEFILQKNHQSFTCPNGGFGSYFFLEFGLHIHWLRAKKVRVYCDHFQRGLLKLHHSCPQDPFGKKMLNRRIYQFLFFGLSAKTFWMFGELFLAGFTETGLKNCRGNFWRKKKNFEWKILFPFSFWHWVDAFQAGGKKFRKCLQSCILRVQRKLLSK